ncbi:MAG: hypothetical protein AB7K68_10665 [Bacteriovoracia bacterium]
MKTLSASKRFLFTTLTVAMAAGQVPFVYAEDASTNIVNAAAGAVGTAAQGVGAYTSSAQQMQQLVNHLGTLNGMQGQMTPQMNALNQMKMNLSTAAIEAQVCVQKAKKDTAKFKKAKFDGKDLETVEATCGNYGDIIDSAKKNAEEMSEVAAKIACIRTMQNKVNQIAETAKAPFNQITQAATKVWSTRDKIIKIHENIAEQIKNDVDGKGGFRDQLGKLQKAAIELNDKVAALGAKVDSIKEQRVTTANNWYFNIMDKTQKCYEGSRQSCFGGAAMSPAQCVERYIGKTAKDNPVSRAQAGKNSEISEAMNSITANKMMEVAQQIEGDAKDPNGFLGILDSRFNKMMNETSEEISNTQFVGNGVKPSELATFVKTRYRACYNSAVNNFKASLKSEGNAYKGSLKSIANAERQVALEAKNLIQTTKNAMTDFKTSFTKTYNRDLSQFSSTCTANNDPNESVDCLRKMQGMLNSGINGHPEEVMLNDGTKINVDAGTTAISIPNLQLDAQGAPSSSAATVTCAGFQECINVLSTARDSHEKAKQTETLNQEKFVETHNSDIQTLMGGIATSFTSMSEMITSATAGLNADFAKYGISASLESKTVKGEELEKDDKTGLFKTPKDMKAAFAGVGSYVEMGDTDDVLKSIEKRRSAIGKKFTEAAKMKSQCALKKSDYASIANALGDCDAEKICKASNMTKMFTPLEAMLRKSQDKADKDDRSKISAKYTSCMSRAKNASGDDDDADEVDSAMISAADTKEERKALLALRSSQLKEKKNAKKAAVSEEKRSCAEQAANELDTLANDSRSSVRVKNGSISAAIKDIAEKCGEDGAEPGVFDTDGAASACTTAKNLLDNYTPPYEGETELSATGDAKKSDNPVKGSSAH